MIIEQSPTKRDIIAFLREAHEHGWPDNATPTMKPELHRFEEVRFKKGLWEYLDLYGGARTDIGFEVVFYAGKPVWGVCYRGGVMSRDVEAGQIFHFLIEALQVPTDSEFPLRGPQEYRNEDPRWLYQCRLQGEFHSFAAVEHLLFEGQLAYERVLLGGCFGDEQLYGPAIPVFQSLFENTKA